MPHVTTDDGVRLYYEEAGSGYPIVFVHEFAGDYRSYETQLRFFSRRYRCIAFNARGYPPSDAGPNRVQYPNKDPRGYAEFLEQLAEHSTQGAANTMRGVQGRRPSLWELTDQMTRIEVPTLIATGDEDDPCLEPGILMKRAIATAALVVFPNTGHALNIEEPDLFNRTLADFFHQVETERWPRRDPRSVTGSILGM